MIDAAFVPSRGGSDRRGGIEGGVTGETPPDAARLVDAAAPATPRSTLGPGDRLKKRPDFRRVQSTGRKIHTPHFVLAALPREGGGATRLGITVTRKVAPAVGRNRIKRVMREVFRRNRDLFPPSSDVVAIAKDGAWELGYAEVLREIVEARKRQRGRS